MLNSVDVWYCTREDVQRALDVKSTARSTQQIDRIIGEVSRQIEIDLGRIFYPLQTTRKFNWPDLPFAGTFPWRLWLNNYEVISVDTFQTGTVTLDPSQYFLEPVNEGPPYNRVEINLATNAAFASADTWQQSIQITGLFGYDDKRDNAGQLAAPIATTAAATCDVTDSSNIGVGSVLVIDTERMLVTGRLQLTSGQNTTGPDLQALASSVQVQVPDGTQFFPWEVITVDAERMLIVDIIGNFLVVKRAWDGSALAVHTSGATVYVGRRLQITRGDLGSTAASHLISAAVQTQRIPVRGLAVAEAEFRLLSEESGMNRSSGSGTTERALDMTALADTRDRYFTRYGRKVRIRTI